MAQQNIKFVSQEETHHLFVLPILNVSWKQMTESQFRRFLPNMLYQSIGSTELDWKNESKKPPWWPSDIQWANIWSNEKSGNCIQTANCRMAVLQKIVISCYKYHGREDLLSVTDEEDVHGDENRNQLSILDPLTEFDANCRLCLSNATSAVVDIFSFCDDEEIASIVSQHFWFQIFKGDGQSDRLCTNCWVAIEGFHKFFKEVQQIHNSVPETFAKIQQIKEEADLNITDTDTASEAEMEEQIQNMNNSYEYVTPEVRNVFETGYDEVEQNQISQIQSICAFPKIEPNDEYCNETFTNDCLPNDTTYEITNNRQIFNMKCRLKKKCNPSQKAKSSKERNRDLDTEEIHNNPNIPNDIKVLSGSVLDEVIMIDDSVCVNDGGVEALIFDKYDDLLNEDSDEEIRPRRRRKRKNEDDDWFATKKERIERDRMLNGPRPRGRPKKKSNEGTPQVSKRKIPSVAAERKKKNPLRKSTENLKSIENKVTKKPPELLFNLLDSSKKFEGKIRSLKSNSFYQVSDAEETKKGTFAVGLINSTSADNREQDKSTINRNCM